MHAAEYLERARAAERRGDYLGAFDTARRGLDAFPDDLALAHRAVLALARSGATAGARALLERIGVRDNELAALDARLCKDEALASRGDERVRTARDAAARYAAIHARTDDAYPAINASTLHLIAGDLAEATALAERVLEVLGAKRPRDEGAAGDLVDYWRAATMAEAALVLGRLDLAAEQLELARRVNRYDHAALATTRKQLALVCAARGLDVSLVDALRPPAVAHYTGHMIGGRFAASSETRVAAEIAAQLASHDVGYGFGALANGGDILFAEALRARGAELHVVLPFDAEQFVRTSVAPGGDAWVERFDACLAAASSVTYGALEARSHDALYAYGSQLAMGLVLVRAGFLATDAVQLAVWDGKPTRGVAGTGADVTTWQRRALPTVVITVDDAKLLPDASTVDDVGANHVRAEMSVKAILFGDVKGYSKLRERDVPAFVEGVLGAFGKAIDDCDVDARNTWGDGLYLVLPDAGAAARCAMRLQGAMRTLAGSQMAGMGLRLAGHVGPVFECFDAVTRQTSYFGSHVTRTARIEPVTPEGTTFVTEPFAAALALGGADFVCEYVGEVPAAKGFGNLRMCVLRERTSSL